MEILTDGALAVFLLEGLKAVIRAFKKDPSYDFPTMFYVVMLAVLQPVSGLILALLEVSTYTIPNDWKSWGIAVVRTGLSAAVSLVVYNAGVKPLKEYANTKRLPEG